MSTASTAIKEMRALRAAVASQTALAGAIPDDPVEFARSVLDLDPWQEEFLSGGRDETGPTRNSGPTPKRRILLAARQNGKSAVGGIIAAHRALSRSNQTVLIVAPSEDQAKVVYRQARRFYYAAGAPIPARSMRETYMELANGSEIIARPAVEQSRRGHAVDLLIVDECASIADDEVYDSLTPSLGAKDGDELILSTPRGKRGTFSKLWHDDPDPDLYRYQVTTFEPEKFRPERLASLIKRRELDRARMPEPWWEQEYQCLFVSGSNQVYPTELVDAAIRPGVTTVVNLAEIWGVSAG